MAKPLLGYPRPNGKYGLRNYVLILSMVQCSNQLANQIAQKTGVVAITHEMGCVESDKSHKVTALALTRAGQHPNAHSVLLVGLGCEQTDYKKIKSDIEKTGKRVEYVSIQQEGGIPEALAKGIAYACEMKAAADKEPRVEIPYKGLVVAVQCGGSDWTTALCGNPSIGRTADLVVKNGGAVRMGEMRGFAGSEHLVAEHAASYEVGKDILNMVKDQRDTFFRETGQRIEEVNPTPGNKEGGITSLVEKSMGNVKKMGSTPVQGILKLGQDTDVPGVWLVNPESNVGPDPFNLTIMALSGANIAIFCSGRGSPVGSAVMPVVKITGNPYRFKLLNGLFDFNSGIALEQGISLDETGTRLFDLLIEKANGESTLSEINGDREFCIPNR